MATAKLVAIKGKAKFDELFKNGIKFRNRDCNSLIKFVTDAKEFNPNDIRVIFYAVAISKKTAKKAVIRNRIKRLLRESLRQLLKEEITLFESISHIIVIWRWAPSSTGLISLSEVKQSVKNILSNSQSYFINRGSKTD